MFSKNIFYFSFIMDRIFIVWLYPAMLFGILSNYLLVSDGNLCIYAFMKIMTLRDLIGKFLFFFKYSYSLHIYKKLLVLLSNLNLDLLYKHWNEAANW